MRALDLLLLPSSVEPLARVALEAMVLSTPILATDVGGLPEIIEEGKTGFLAPPGDVQTWTRRILELLADRETLVRAGARGHVVLTKQLADAAYAEAMTSLYAEAAMAPQPWWRRRASARPHAPVRAGERRSGS
jgi:glycosyltransferase involved in cell wall biosynthesis